MNFWGNFFRCLRLHAAYNNQCVFLITLKAISCYKNQIFIGIKFLLFCETLMDFSQGFILLIYLWGVIQISRIK